MKRRMITGTGLGASSPNLISGQPTGDKKRDSLLNKIAKDCYETFGFEKYGYCDAGFEGEEARFGVEPSYKFDPLKLITIAKEKDDSKYITGRAVGYYGSEVQSTVKEYGDYTKQSKFVRFVDKWHGKLFTTNNQ